MKSILVHAETSPAMRSRLDAATAIARRHGAHLSLMLSTPYSRYIAMDPFGGAHLAAAALERVRAENAVLEAEMAAALAGEGVSWDITAESGDSLGDLSAAAALADLVIVGLGDATPRALLAGDLALATSVPVLALPTDASAFDLDGPALVAWNGSAEAAAALRHAMPLLAGRKVTVVTATGTSGAFPDTDAMKYLARHGISAELQPIAPQAAPPEEILARAAEQLGAKLVVMGAFGRSRLAQTIFGGVTQYMLTKAKLPLLLSH